jgi:hypothetical protein
MKVGNQQLNHKISLCHVQGTLLSNKNSPIQATIIENIARNYKVTIMIHELKSSRELASGIPSSKHSKNTHEHIIIHIRFDHGFGIM